MPNQLLIDLLVRQFSRGVLPHPGDENTPSHLIPLPGFRGAGMSDEQTQEMIGSAAKEWAEAIESIISGEFDCLTKADAAQLRQDAADAPDGTRIITVYRQSDHQRQSPLLQLTLGKTNDVTIPDRQLGKLTAHE
ncbi:hypothetical protein PROPHIGD91-2_69 [Mycobacterium phage prophiGD91-2]|uniref:hypothetical protein n=1 Tax=Mycobacteroides abscessus TaxID=36809 RepID=UPI0019D09572|nr:hypothetical protein [Mycobacteroides abscessus]QSM03922.1 hypothetical protein PROPHIGD91-2_69 [Mycobacterium phage prophiGD91-2]QSM90525.1 hypothetical protein I3U44_07600 [Mycobacteroides abscessus subsp. bolletii]QSM90809.1 hypothetical protein I3U44_09235 [Mycobacteroides abscessus subsp. bolletii]